ncbi:putative adhesin [Pantoea sp. A4]|uniref:putative adhesin n=1 Tax=Pantoea sp. A4 TaxID=1225184 RepID=UPI00037E4649
MDLFDWRGSNISHKDEVLEKLFDRAMRRLLADFDYYTYNPRERDKERMIGHAKQLLLAVTAIAGVVTVVATGPVAAAALATGLAAEAAEIALSAEQMRSADRGDKYLDAYTDVFVGTILLSTFGVSDLNALVRIAAKSRGEFTAAVKSARKIANELKEGGSAKSLLKEATDLNKASNHAKRVIDEQLKNGVINQARHKELTDSVTERNAGITTLSPTPTPTPTRIPSPSIQPAVVPQPYVPSQWKAGTPQPSPYDLTNFNYQVDSNGPWRLVYPLDDKADTLTLFNHGKYFSSKPTTAVPEGIKIEFVTPHGSAASLPGERSFMHNEIMPFSTVDHKKFTISSYRDPQKTESVPLSDIRDIILGPGKKPKVSDDEKRVLATGTDKKGSIINYINLPFNPDKGTGNYVESDFVRFTEKNRVAQDSANHADIKEGLNIPSNQSFTPAEKTDFLFLDKDASHGLTSQALEIAKEKGYKKVRLLHCRVERGKEADAMVYHINPHIPKDVGNLAGSGEKLYMIEFDLINNTVRIIPMTPVSAVANASDIDVEETNSAN